MGYVAIEVKRMAMQKILNYLYKYSDLQITFGMNMVAIRRKTSTAEFEGHAGILYQPPKGCSDQKNEI